MGYFHCSTDVLFDVTIAYVVLKSPRKVFQHVSREETDGTFFLHANPNSIEATHPAYIYILKQYNIYTSSYETTLCQLLVPSKQKNVSIQLMSCLLLSNHTLEFM